MMFGQHRQTTTMDTIFQIRKKAEKNPMCVMADLVHTFMEQGVRGFCGLEWSPVEFHMTTITMPPNVTSRHIHKYMCQCMTNAIELVHVIGLDFTSLDAYATKKFPLDSCKDIVRLLVFCVFLVSRFPRDTERDKAMRVMISDWLLNTVLSSECMNVIDDSGGWVSFYALVVNK